VKIHVQAARIVSDCGSIMPACGEAVRLDVTIDGRKFELRNNDTEKWLIHTGDYNAKIKSDETNELGFQRTYEILFPNGLTRRFVVVGEIE
jgi:hypothetical protein